MSRQIRPINHVGAKAAIESLMHALGFDHWEDAGLKGTPDRVARMYQELLAGYDLEADNVLSTDFPTEGYDEFVWLRDIEFASLCEHHMLPFTGVATVAYQPASKVVGISKLARLVEMHARRLQIQERMTVDIADDIERVLSPHGVMVLIEAKHQCMGCRGVKKPGSVMGTSVVRGGFKTDHLAKGELMTLIGRTR